MATRVTYPLFKAFTADGTFGIGYKIYTYEAGTSTPLTTYQDSSASTPHTNPIILDSLGEKEIFINQSAKFTLTDADDNVQTNWPIDNISPFSVTAAEVSYIPSGDLVSDNVQDALDEIVLMLEDFVTDTDVTTDTLELPDGQEMEGGIVGLDCSADTDSDHDVLTAIGACFDSTNTTAGKNSTAKTKQIDAEWSEGDDGGGLLDHDEEAVAANTLYNFYALFRDSDGELDFGWVSNDRDIEDYLPDGYSHYRWLRYHMTNSSSNIKQTTQVADRILHHKASDWVVSSGITTSYATVDHSTFIPAAKRIAGICYAARDAAAEATIVISEDGTNTAFTVGDTATTISDTASNIWGGVMPFYPYNEARQYKSTLGTLDLVIHAVMMRR